MSALWTPIIQLTFQPIPPDIPQGAVVITIAFFVTIAVVSIGVPLVRALVRRVDQRGASPAVPSDLAQRMERIEQAVDAIAIEVERISEGQRFTNKLMSERQPSAALPSTDVRPH